MTSQIDNDLKIFYDLLSRLEHLPHQGLQLRQLPAQRDIPMRGVYFFRESDEFFNSDGVLRIVRVGTHAVSEGAKSTLRSRLKTHLGSQSGMGNHRGSIFRLHIGRALLNQERHAIPTWGIGSIAPQELRSNPIIKEAEAHWERKVSKRIGEMSVLWVDIPDEPSSTSERAYIEKNAIGLLSNQRNPIAPASSKWLGRSSDRQEIRTSLLWNLKHVDEIYDPAFLVVLKQAVDRTCQTSHNT